MNFSKYIGISYKNLGRDFDGVDCFGLVWLVLKNEKGISLPTFTEIEYNPGLRNGYESVIIDNLEKNQDIYIEASKPYKVFDIPIFFGGSNNTVVNHTGIFIDEDKFLHIRENTLSMVGKLNKYHLSKLFKVIRVIKNA